MTGALALDLGGTQVRAALVRGGTVLKRAAALTDVAGGPRLVFEQVRALVAQISTPQERREMKAMGCCLPGPVDSDTGIVLYIATLPGWEDFPLRAELAGAFGLPTIIENDAIAAAVGEWRHGAGRGLRHLVYVTVSTGVGGGAIVDGRVLHGARGMASHFGHMSLTPDGPPCSCGRAGCFEAMASGSALGRRAQTAAARGVGYLAEVAARGAIGAKDVVAGARMGDAVCLDLMGEEAEWLGMGFVNLIHIHSPERVIMGGGVAQAFDLLADRVAATVRRDALPPFRAVPVVAAELGENSGLIGAAAQALEAA